MSDHRHLTRSFYRSELCITEVQSGGSWRPSPGNTESFDLTLEAAKALELIKPCLDPASYPGSSLLEVRIK